MSNETLGELIDRVGEQEAMNYLLAQSIQLRSALYNLLHAIDQNIDGCYIDFWDVVTEAKNALNYTDPNTDPKDTQS